MDVEFVPDQLFTHHRIWRQAESGCRACARQAFNKPSDSAEAAIGCRVCARQALNMPSDSAEAVIGCRVCARQAFCTPSELAEIENGCRASARQARKVPGRPEKPHISIPAINKSIPQRPALWYNKQNAQRMSLITRPDSERTASERSAGIRQEQ